MEINAHNYKEVLLQWLEGELSPTEVLQAEAFILVNETAAREWQLLKKTKLQPTQQVFFPKKHLLMKEEQDVVIAQTAEVNAAEQETVIRTLSGGFNYKKFALPISIAASLLLFFLFFTNRNSVHDNVNGPVTKVEGTQPGTGNKAINAETEITNSGAEKAESEIEVNTKQLASVNNSASTINTSNKTRKPAYIKKEKVFSTDNIYAKKEIQSLVSDKQEIAQVKFNLPVIENETGTANTKKLKKSLSKQNEELEQWQQAADKQNQELALGTAEETERGVLTRITHFFTNNVKVKKRTEDDINHYAFSLETENIKIVKTFKSQF